jgi:hypothetical protein
VTVIQVFDTYEDFWDVALPRLPTLLLVLLNIAFTWIAVVIASAAVKPTRKVVYAILIAVSFQAVLATEFEVQPLSGAESVGGVTTIKLAPYYTPIADQISEDIDDPVEDEVAKEIDALRAAYPTDDSLTNLQEEMEERVLRERSLDTDDRRELVKELTGILVDADLTVRERLRDLAFALYAKSQRGLVRDLGGLDGT